METQGAGKASRSGWVLGALAVAVGVLLGAIAVVAFWPGDSGAEAVSLVRADDAGADPFTESMQTGEVPVIEQPAIEAASAVRTDLPQDDTTAVLVATGTAPGLYGGSGDAQVCDAAKLVAYLDQHPDKAQAFSGVLGITPEEIGDYVASLTPVVLLSDTVVTNHGFEDGRATAMTSVLQTGTAVMVDAQGVPRVKCNCGNPLTPPEVVPSADWDVRGDAWDGFDAASVTGVVGGDTVEEFTLCDLITGERYTVPVGWGPSEGTAPPNLDGDWKVELREAFDLGSPLDPGRIPDWCPNARLEDAVLVIRGTRASIANLPGFGPMEGTLTGAPAGAPEWLQNAQRSYDGVTITLRPVGEDIPVIEINAATSRYGMNGLLNVTVQDRASQCDTGVAATRIGSESEPAPAPTPSTTVTAPPVAVAELRGVDWRNRAYGLGDGCPGGQVTLRNGTSEDPAAGVGVRLAGVLYGDLTGDGNDEAVVKFECYPIGGNANPVSVNVVFTSDTSGAVQLGNVFTGMDATIVGDAVQTTKLVWGPSDPRCCPSTTETQTWRFTNGAWVS